jgi:hypothetical protein
MNAINFLQWIYYSSLATLKLRQLRQNGLSVYLVWWAFVIIATEGCEGVGNEFKLNCVCCFSN